MLRVIHEMDGLLEAPRPASDGSILFVNVGAGGVFEFRDGAVGTVLPARRGIGGLAHHADGGLLVTGRDVIAYDGKSDPVPVLSVPGSTGYNDVTVDRDGALLVGVLRHRPSRGEPATPSEVLRLDASGAISVVESDLLWPNGIGHSPDGRTIYISEYAAGRVRAVRDGGSDIFATAPRGECDGLAVDVEGGVWVALGSGGGIARFHPDGTLDEIIDVPDAFVSSVAFADTTMVVTTAGALLSGTAGIAGLPIPAARVPH
ncbi:SMP-30/gluconolactonase/LRE family protein [Nocardia sp. NPDC058058]|uniref:SMP-30/gluconolactonase/LRE family protein n=1 Tax=Nocardia sp. NPDC058058 TaxID=3346317 RepID=UPI0036DA0F43